jgi:putative ABC transport system permease protein
LAIIPGVTLADLWRSLSNIDSVLKIISWMVIVVGMGAMLSSLLSGLNERRREMSILRALGASPSKITFLLIFESGILTISGICLGILVEIIGFSILRTWLESHFGLYVSGSTFTGTEIMYISLTLSIGLLTGLIPAIIATRSALKDGLSIRV